MDLDDRIVRVLGLRHVLHEMEQMRMGAQSLRDRVPLVEPLRRAQQDAAHVRADARHETRLGLFEDLVLLEPEVAVFPGEELEDRVLGGRAEHVVELRARDGPRVDQVLEDPDGVLAGLDRDLEHLLRQESPVQEALQEALGIDGVRFEEPDLVLVHDEHGTRRTVAEVERPRTPGESVLEHAGESQLLEAAL